MKILILAISIVFISGLSFTGYNIYKIEQTYNWLEKKTIWCYERGGTMIEAQCVKLERLDMLAPSNQTR